MSRTGAVFRFELAYQFRRLSTLGYFLILLGMGTPFLQMMASGTRLDGTDFNSPFAVLVTVMFGSMLALLILAAFAADAATRDADVRIDSLFYTSPVGKRAYLTGRFLAAAAMSVLVLMALPIGCIVATWMPWVDPESVGPFRASALLGPYLLFALPNGVVAAALLFAIAIVTRRAIASYAGAALLFFFALFCHKVLAPRLGWDAAKLVDPLGFTTVQEWFESLSPLQKNTLVLTLDGALLANRLLWLGIALAAWTLAYARFRLAHAGDGRGGAAAAPGRGDVPVRAGAALEVPAARRVFDQRTRMRQLFAVAARSFGELHASRAWWIVPFLALLFIQAAPELAEHEMGLPGPLTTARLVDFLTADVSILFTLLIALSAGELVWRERGARIQAIAAVTPVPDWLAVAGKFLGLAMMLAAAMILFLLAGLAVQTAIGTDRYDLPLYFQLLFGLQLPEYLLTAVLAMVVHVVVNQKHVANVLIVLTPFARDLVRQLGLEEDLLLYGSLPRWVYSEISGFGLTFQSRLWFILYFGGWALLFALVTYLFWVRGDEHDLRQRIALARRRLTGWVTMAGVTALAIIAAAGGFIFYSTHVVDEHVTTAESEWQRAEYERRYGRYAALAQPRPVAAKLHVDFHPRHGTATIRGSYRLENRTSAPVAAIHCAISSGPERTDISFDRPSRLALSDEDLGYRIYALERALEPGESVRMMFDVAIVSRLFQQYGTPPVVENGSVIIHRPRDGDHWLPVVGYQPVRELDNAVLRKKYGLRERSPYPRLGDTAVGTEQHGYRKIELETIIGTDAGQIGVAPGVMHRTWIEKASRDPEAPARRYVHYRTDAPISEAWTITAARYAVRRAKWGEVDIEVFHHPSHTANVERMVHGVQASLGYFTKHFGPYPHRQVRLVEYPSQPYWLQMTAHDGLITYAEGVSLIRAAEDPRKIDFPFAVAAHEMGHQWFGHQLTPANVEGAPFLAESLSWYSAMLVVEETFGRDHLTRLLDVMRAQYLGSRQPRVVPLLRAADHLDAYRRGPFAMFALRETAGVETVNGALRRLLARFPPGREPFPTALDFYAELRRATPPSMHPLLRDLIEEVTFWELQAKSMDVQAAGSGAHRVMLQVEARKLKGDGTGNERPAPMNDPVEVVVYDAEGRTLHRATHRIRSGMQTIEIVVARPPARAVLDPDHELVDRNPEDNAVAVEGAAYAVR